MIRSLLSLSALSLATFALACSDDGTGPGGGDFGTGGIGSGTGGALGATGGATGTGGDISGTGSVAGTGGDVAGTGGDVAGTGGADPGGTVFACPAGSESTVLDLTGKMVTPIDGVPAPPGNSYSFTEGPVWLDGALYFSQLYGNDNPQASNILKYTPGGSIEVFIDGAGTNGLALNAAGLLVGASQKATGIVTFDPANPAAAATVLTAQYNGAPFNSPNDLTVRADGNIYFTDPNYQCNNCTNQPVKGVYRLPPGGQPELLTTTQDTPNGIALSPDGNTLYVGGSTLTAHPVMADGSVGAGAPFGNASSTDGLGVDCAGNVYVTLNGQGTLKIVDKTGAPAGEFTGIANITNVAFGGPGNTTLYITNQDQNGSQLRSVELNVPGFPY